MENTSKKPKFEDRRPFTLISKEDWERNHRGDYPEIFSSPLMLTEEEEKQLKFYFLVKKAEKKKGFLPLPPDEWKKDYPYVPYPENFSMKIPKTEEDQTILQIRLLDLKASFKKMPKDVNPVDVMEQTMKNSLKRLGDKEKLKESYKKLASETEVEGFKEAYQRVFEN